MSNHDGRPTARGTCGRANETAGRCSPDNPFRAAIDAASPGTTIEVAPATYQENLLIAKDGITLRGAGPGRTVLVPPAEPAPVCLLLFFPPADLENNGVNGICIANVDQHGNILSTVHDVRVTGFTVQGFPGVGILVQDSSTGRVTGNTLRDSCSGLVFLNTGTGTGVKDWVATDNSVTHNNNFCPAGATGLPFTLTGLGVLIAGGKHIVLRDNTVRANQLSGPPITLNGVALSGGIVVVSTANVSVFPGFQGSDAAGNTTMDNTVTGNQPFDLVYDRLSKGNRFLHNECSTSNPPGLCHSDTGD